MKRRSALSLCSETMERRESSRRRSVCCGKGERRESLDALTDDVLIEILRRLPNAKSASGFKLVSKRWCSLISSPYFVSNFITHQLNINKLKPYDAVKQFTTDTCVFACAKTTRKQSLFSIIRGTKFDSHENEFALEFLPVERELVSVIASCCDLLLCRVAKKDSFTDYYVCNPCTKQWLLLPPPHPINDFRVYFGLVYEPNYEGWVQGIKESRFRVVSVRESFDHYVQIQIYCSENRQWKWNDPLVLSQDHRVGSNIVAYNGKLYWHNHRDVVDYDPFRGEIVFVDGSDDEEFDIDGCSRSVSTSLGICQGYLRVMKLVNFRSSRGDDVNYLIVWEFCTETRRLNMKHRIFLVPQPETGGFLRVQIGFIDVLNLKLFDEPKTLAFHPKKEDLVYLEVGRHIISCELPSGKLEGLLVKIPFRMMEIFTILLPWWPTPIPMLPHSSHP